MKQSKEQSNTELFGEFALRILIVIVLAVAGGYVLVCFWNWFMIPVFNVPSLGVLEGAGIRLLSVFLTKTIHITEEDKTLMEITATAFGYYIVFLLVGAIIALALGTF